MPDSPRHFRSAWERQLSRKSYPESLGNIIRVEAGTFIDRVLHANEREAGDLVGSILAGDAYVLKNAHSEDHIDSLRSRLIAWRSEQSVDNTQKITEGCLDYHAVNDVLWEGKEYYQTLEHTHGFFRWNGDPLGIFAMLDPYWRAIKMLSGNDPAAFLHATPRNGTIDKLAVYQYPMTFGKVTKHADPSTTQKLLLNLPMGKTGRDYAFGSSGFYAVDGDTGKKIYLEHTMNLGDYICLCPSVHHGADPVQPFNKEPDKKADWESPRGRWLLTAISVPSHEVKNRVSTVAIND